MNPVSMLPNDRPVVPAQLVRSDPKSLGEPAPAATSSAQTNAAGVGPPAVAGPQTPPQAKLAASSQTDEKQLTEAVKRLNEALKLDGRTLQFSVDKDTGMTVVQIRDQTTNEVIRQIPSEETLKLAKDLEKNSGMLFKGEA